GGAALGRALADGESDGEADDVGEADEAVAVGSSDGAPDDGSGTLARTSSGAAPSRDGVSYVNIPLAHPAAPTTRTTAPATANIAPRRRLRGGVPSASGAACPAGTGAIGCVASNRSRSVALGRVVAGPRGVGSA
ncbi:hypothetical protein AB8O53_35595, partial [Streptomyces pilosus]